jgi:citrate lyase subunit beta/citryl-CoA lyase
MSGVFCIHPAQVEIANARFAPSETELADARAILAAWEAAQREGRAVVSLNGRMIDAPVVKRALRLVGRT